jgi:hypothetical protein
MLWSYEVEIMANDKKEEAEKSKCVQEYGNDFKEDLQEGLRELLREPTQCA